MVEDDVGVTVAVDVDPAGEIDPVSGRGLAVVVFGPDQFRGQRLRQVLGRGRDDEKKRGEKEEGSTDHNGEDSHWKAEDDHGIVTVSI